MTTEDRVWIVSTKPMIVSNPVSIGYTIYGCSSIMEEQVWLNTDTCNVNLAISYGLCTVILHVKSTFLGFQYG